MDDVHKAYVYTLVWNIFNKCIVKKRSFNDLIRESSAIKHAFTNAA